MEDENQVSENVQKGKKKPDFFRRVFGQSLGAIILAIILSSISGILVKNNTESEVKAAVLDELKQELQLHNDNRTLSEAIIEIKGTLEQTKSELDSANAQLQDLDDAKKQINDLNAELATYVYYNPEVTVDGLPVSTEKDPLLSHKGKLYYDESILKHFFSDQQMKWENGHLDFSTEGAAVTINPLLKGAVDLTTMEVTRTSDYPYFDSQSKADNNNVIHHNVIYTQNSGTQYIEYRLDKEYRWFECSAFVTKTAANYSYNSGIWDSASISITVDNGIALWGTESISRDADIQHSGLIDISGVKYIKITFYNTAPYTHGDPHLVLEKPLLYLE